ncbi:MAG: BlaI/MecI/CopY family transcriptional regulator [Rhodothermales bacterium]|nr:BlaI/MecI/CopY family transcriptional regulator [Rhodothermales bacterium]
MAKRKRREFSPLQAMVMKVLWERGESTVSEVQQQLKDERTFAHNTVATVLTRLVDDRVVAVRKIGRANTYRPTVAERAVKSTMVMGLVSRMFEGSPSALVHHLLSEGEIDPAELESLARLVGRSKKSDK